MATKPDGYTDEQWALVTAAGSFFAEACPGAGKTRAIVARFIRRAREERRKGIALLSFTNVAVDEVRLRCGHEVELIAPPHFIGTFDAFINRYLTTPLYVRTYRKAPQAYIESWSAIPRTSVRCAKHTSNAYELDWFSFGEGGAATLEESRAGGIYKQGLLKDVATCRDDLEQRATSIYKGLVKNSGLLSSSASRWFANAQIGNADVAVRMGTLLAHRFAEVIVDEAQDCGPEELAILDLLRHHGVNVVLIGDLDQSIYEFRRATPDKVKEFITDGPPFALTGNFRSSRAICRVNDSLRVGTTRDEAVGCHKDVPHPVQLIEMNDGDSVSKTLTDVVSRFGLDTNDLVVLSHRKLDASKAAGVDESDGIGNSNVAAIAMAWLAIKSEADPRARKAAIETVERVILKVLGLGGDDRASVSATCDAAGVDRRWLADLALRLTLRANPHAISAGEYASKLREFLGRVKWPRSLSPGRLSDQLKAPREGQWSKLAPASSEMGLSWSSIHAAKGKEFPAVALVIPKKPVTDPDGKTALDHWEAGTSAEVRRVLYVGASRAEQILLLVAHANHTPRVADLLEKAEIPFDRPTSQE